MRAYPTPKLPTPSGLEALCGPLTSCTMEDRHQLRSAALRQVRRPGHPFTRSFLRAVVGAGPQIRLGKRNEGKASRAAGQGGGAPFWRPLVESYRMGRERAVVLPRRLVRAIIVAGHLTPPHPYPFSYPQVLSHHHYSIGGGDACICGLRSETADDWHHRTLQYGSDHSSAESV